MSLCDEEEEETASRPLSANSEYELASVAAFAVTGRMTITDSEGDPLAYVLDSSFDDSNKLLEGDPPEDAAACHVEIHEQKSRKTRKRKIAEISNQDDEEKPIKKPRSGRRKVEYDELGEMAGFLDESDSKRKSKSKPFDMQKLIEIDEQETSGNCNDNNYSRSNAGRGSRNYTKILPTRNPTTNKCAGAQNNSRQVIQDLLIGSQFASVDVLEASTDNFIQLIEDVKRPPSLVTNPRGSRSSRTSIAKSKALSISAQNVTLETIKPEVILNDTEENNEVTEEKKEENNNTEEQNSNCIESPKLSPELLPNEQIVIINGSSNSPQNHSKIASLKEVMNTAVTISPNHSSSLPPATSNHDSSNTTLSSSSDTPVKSNSPLITKKPSFILPKCEIPIGVEYKDEFNDGEDIFPHFDSSPIRRFL